MPLSSIPKSWSMKTPWSSLPRFDLISSYVSDVDVLPWRRKKGSGWVGSKGLRKVVLLGEIPDEGALVQRVNGESMVLL